MVRGRWCFNVYDEDMIYPKWTLSFIVIQSPSFIIVLQDTSVSNDFSNDLFLCSVNAYCVCINVIKVKIKNTRRLFIIPFLLFLEYIIHHIYIYLFVLPGFCLLGFLRLLYVLIKENVFP